VERLNLLRGPNSTDVFTAVDAEQPRFLVRRADVSDRIPNIDEQVGVLKGVGAPDVEVVGGNELTSKSCITKEALEVGLDQRLRS
jgi:hypothetical protein